MSTPMQRCGFVSVIGLPNAGKSTLVNALVGAKVSIVSRKVQTTRMRVMGIAMHNHAQIILIDTPGIFQPKKTLEKAMVGAALSSVEDTEFVLHIVDVNLKNPLRSNQMILDMLRNQHENTNVLLVLNKIDQFQKEKLLTLAQEMCADFPYAGVFMISALKNKGVEDIADYLSEHLCVGEWLYPEDQISDLPMRLMAAEITREQVYNQLHQELPYSIYVETESWEEFDNGDVKISQIVYVQKQSQKGIVLGKGGVKLKSIGKAARTEMEEMMERRVHLNLFVRVQENWPERPEFYEVFGLSAVK